MAQDSILPSDIHGAFGEAGEDMDEVLVRMREILPGEKLIVWQGDPATFAFSYVGGDAEELLGFPDRRWVAEPDFWVSTVVSELDRESASAFCALATGRGADHEFEYRANTADGDSRWLRDLVRVYKGQRGVPTLLRGVMIDITERKHRLGETEPGPVRPNF